MGTLSDARHSRPVAETATDAELLGCLVDRADRDAFALLYDRHAGTVYAFAITRLHEREDAEEITQDVFLTLWRRRSSVRLTGESVLPWLLVSCRNLALNRLRANAVLRRRRGAENLLFPVDVGGASPEAQIELGEAIEHAVSLLGSLDQAILRVCLLEGRSYDEAASELGTTNAVIRNRLSRLKYRLRDELRPLRGT